MNTKRELKVSSQICTQKPYTNLDANSVDESSSDFPCNAQHERSAAKAHHCAAHNTKQAKHALRTLKSAQLMQPQWATRFRLTSQLRRLESRAAGDPREKWKVGEMKCLLD